MADTVATGGRLPPMPSFAEFYRALNDDRAPFPWQVRLADEVATNERWRSIGVPTGLGKTACLDIAVWWLASQAHRPPGQRTAPTRIWWVVNRRLLVDSTAGHAEAIAAALRDPESAGLTGREREIVARVACRLRSLSADPGAAPLEVIRLRGGIAADRPTDPSQPAIALCTLPMYGSRLLFRGYGSFQRFRVVDAAMAGADSLVLLDEAHLAPHLKALFPALAACTPGAPDVLGGARTRASVAALTATGDPGDEPFLLDAADYAHPTVRERLDADKPVELRSPTTGHAARCLADAALDLLERASRPAACLVFANTPRTARETFQRLRKLTPKSGSEVLLLTGLSREREAERLRERILDPVDGMPARAAKGDRQPDSRGPGRPSLDVGECPVDHPRRHHLIVVATQTLEVGADIDADYLVTEACGVRALTQRLGRLNRLGRRAHARAIYVHLPAAKGRRGAKAAGSGQELWLVYGSEPEIVRQRLQDACDGLDGHTVNLPPGRVAEVLGAPSDDPGRAPELLPGILWEWTKTTTPPDGEAPVEPYFSGISGVQYSVSLIWRAHVPPVGDRLWPPATDREAVDVPIAEIRSALGDEEIRRLTSDGVTIESTSAADLRPGDQIVLPTDRGLLDEFGWNPAAAETVVDASLDRHGLPLDAQAIERLCGVSVAKLVDTALGVAADGEDIDHYERNEAIEEVLRVVRAARTPPSWQDTEWSAFTQSLTPQVVEARKEVPRLPVAKPAPESHNGDLDETSLAPTAVDLDLHGQAVGERARAIAERIGLSPRLVEVVERAGRLHDIGKADRRFQRWLDPDGQRGVLVAKSNAPRHLWEAMRSAARWPRGGRHEDLSARLVRAWLEHRPDWGDPLLRDLLLHLVISHHGKGRPLVPPIADGTPEEVSGAVECVAVAAPADLGIVDWSQPARFRRLDQRFGPWGLALLEAIVIRADHAVSAGADPRPEEAGS